MASKKGKQYFIGKETTRGPRVFYIRPRIVPTFHAALSVDAWRRVPLYKQILPVMAICKESRDYLTKGEFIALLREPLSTAQPNPLELKHFDREVLTFRKWLGATAGLILYPIRKEFNEKTFKGWETIYRPITDKDDYETFKKHIQNVGKGLVAMNKRNEKLLNMTQKEIDTLFKDTLDQLRQEAQGY